MSDDERPSVFFNAAAIAFDADVAIALLADLQIRRAIERGEFDDLPGSGRPIDLSDSHDPDWWLKSLMRREGMVLLPASIQLRKDDAALDELLDGLPNEHDVRQEIEQFNARVIRARYDLSPGPPLVTMPRDVDETVRAWRDRRAARRAEARAAQKSGEAREGTGRRGRRRRVRGRRGS
ncbi:MULTISPECIES: J-domain-containing protein [unclassified Microbacterium]|uniref:DnaJ family domain-containing protein n=1 Tax=unclassified Microbacterium TaxID=2609290 RepID=UPI00300FFA8A